MRQLLLAGGLAGVVIVAVVGVLALPALKRAVEVRVSRSVVVPSNGPVPTTQAKLIRTTPSEDKRIAWEKLRKQVNDERKATTQYNVVAFFIKDSEWKMHNPEGFYASKIPRRYQGGPVATELDSVYMDRSATAAANDPRIKVAAIVDLYSQPNPFAVSWFVGDGTTATKHTTCPLSGFDKSLSEYFYFLQTEGID